MSHKRNNQPQKNQRKQAATRTVPEKPKPSVRPKKPTTNPGSNRTGARRTTSKLKLLFEHHQAVATESLHRLLLDPAASLLTWLVIGIALALPLSLLLLLQNLQQLGADLGQASNITLYMEMAIPEDELETIQENLSTRSGIESVELVLPDQALQEFEINSGFGNVLSGLDENPLPAVLIITPALADAGAIADLFTELDAMPQVEFAQLDLEWVQRLYGIINLAQRLATMLAAMLCVGVILVIGNTVRLAIENRRDEIVVVKLVGGTDAYVARPFLYTGLWYGAGGGLIAAVIIICTLWGLQGPVSRLVGYYGNEFSLIGLSLSSTLLVILCAGALGWTGALISVFRNLRAIQPR